MEPFDQHSDNYADQVNQAVAFSGLNVDFFTRVKVEYLAQLCRARLKVDNVSVLDVGCGVGLSHQHLAQHVEHITGVDVSASSISKAQSMNPQCTYAHYSGQVLPFEDGFFDCTVTTCVMHHVKPAQWPAFVTEMARVTRPGGLVVVFEHNPRNPLTRRVVNNCEFDADATLLRSPEMEKLFHNAGLQQVRSQYILSIPAAGRWLRSVDAALSGLGLGAQYFTWAITS